MKLHGKNRPIYRHIINSSYKLCSKNINVRIQNDQSQVVPSAELKMHMYAGGLHGCILHTFSAITQAFVPTVGCIRMHACTQNCIRPQYNKDLQTVYAYTKVMILSEFESPGSENSDY
jgi:hypothetical protein